MIASSSQQGPIASVLTWLASDPEDDCFQDLASLTQHSEKLRGLDLLEIDQGLACLEGLVERATDIGERFKAQIVAAQGNLSQVLKLGACNLAANLVLLAQLHHVNAVQVLMRKNSRAREQSLSIWATSLRILTEAFLLCCMSGRGERMKGLWLQAYVSYTHIAQECLAQVEQQDELEILTVEFKRLVALVILHPEGLSPRELLWIHEYLDRAASEVTVSSSQLQPEQCAFWFDPNTDAPPIACIRRLPPPHGAIWFCTATPLAKYTNEHIERLEQFLYSSDAGTSSKAEDWLGSGDDVLPLGLAPAEVFSLLNRLRARWAQPATREHVRRTKHYTVQVCEGLRNIWSLHRGGRVPPEAILEWSVCNESAGGFGVVTVAGMAEHLNSGMPLAVRRQEDEAWSICIVRWVRLNESGRLELGLQTLGSGCAPISIAFRGAEPRVTTPALLLSSLPGVRNNAAILAPAGTYSSRRFVLIREGAQLYVAQGRVLSLDMQTASVELFQYEVDPFPI